VVFTKSAVSTVGAKKSPMGEKEKKKDSHILARPLYNIIGLRVTGQRERGSVKEMVAELFGVQCRAKTKRSWAGMRKEGASRVRGGEKDVIARIMRASQKTRHEKEMHGAVGYVGIRRL